MVCSSYRPEAVCRSGEYVHHTEVWYVVPFKGQESKAGGSIYVKFNYVSWGLVDQERGIIMFVYM